MNGSGYAIGAPWLRFARQCQPEGRNEIHDWLAAMTGRRGQHGRHGHGQWGMFGGPMPFGPPWAGGPKGPWRGPKARRGDVRAAILAVLAEQQLNGYQIIQEIAERSDGAWKPSPGSIYPTLQQLEDEGLVSADRDSGRRTFTLTDEGRSYVESHAEEVRAPWQAMTAAGDDDESGLKPLIGQVAAAIWQLQAVGSPDQQVRTREALAELRRTLYAILAEDHPDEEHSAGGRPNEDGQNEGEAS